MLKVCKFGGTSLADAGQFEKVKQIIDSDDARRVIVVSAPGKRHPADQKITDLLYLLHASLQAEQPSFSVFEKIRFRFLEIEKSLGLSCNMDTVCTAIYAGLTKNTPLSYLVSRGEYLCAKLMAAYLGATFVDSARWLVFGEDGTVDEDLSAQRLQMLCGTGCIVTTGFYGISHRGEIEVFSRGGSDITGALAAKFLEADEYENWTDVDGLLAANPSVVSHPETVRNISYSELMLLSQAELQVLHSSAILPVRQAHVPLTIRNTNNPAGAFTTVSEDELSSPLVIAEKQIGNDAFILILLIRDEAAKRAVNAAIVRNHPLFSVYRQPCYYALFGAEYKEKIMRSVYASVYKNGSQ